MKKFKIITPIITGGILLSSIASYSQWTINGTTVYYNPMSSSVSIGSSAVPLSGVKLDLNNGNFRLNSNTILLKDDANHGLAYFYQFASTFLMHLK